MIIYKRICRRCDGSGWRLRPTPKKLFNCIRCTHCGGKGVRFKVERTAP